MSFSNYEAQSTSPNFGTASSPGSQPKVNWLRSPSQNQSRSDDTLPKTTTASVADIDAEHDTPDNKNDDPALRELKEKVGSLLERFEVGDGVERLADSIVRVRGLPLLYSEKKVGIKVLMMVSGIGDAAASKIAHWILTAKIPKPANATTLAVSPAQLYRDMAVEYKHVLHDQLEQYRWSWSSGQNRQDPADLVMRLISGGWTRAMIAYDLKDKLQDPLDADRIVKWLFEDFAVVLSERSEVQMDPMEFFKSKSPPTRAFWQGPASMTNETTDTSTRRPTGVSAVEEVFRLLDLPPEFRMRIYRATIVASGFKGKCKVSSTTVEEAARQGNLLASCRQIKEEIGNMLYEDNTF